MISMAAIPTVLVSIVSVILIQTVVESEASPAASVVTSNEVSMSEENFTLITTQSVTDVSEETSTTIIQEDSSDWGRSERPAHPCKRPCLDGGPQMICHYNFAVEWYYAMSKACYNCSHNISDCFRPDCIAADGVKRTIITVNKMIPGPSIEVCLGDHIVVDVANHLSEEGTSIHWHGHHQRSSPYMDGVPFISQCPIPSNSVFRYQFHADNSGTHFWHSHTGLQRGDGVYGSLIIRTSDSMNPHSDLYDEDLSEHTLSVLDWSHQLGVTMFTAHYHSNGDNKPNSMLVNGRGRYFNDSQQLTSTPLEVFTVKKGQRYRFRLINAGVQNCPIELKVDNHTLTVISSDGSDIKPMIVDSLVSYAGERWDFVISAEEDVDNYWMRFTGLMDCDERFLKAHQVAILHYEGAVKQDPQSPTGYNVHHKSPLQLNALNVELTQEGTLSVPHLEATDTKPDPSLKEVADQQIYIAFDFYPKDNPHYHKSKLYGFLEVSKQERVYTPQFNDISMKLPHFPLLSQYNSINKDTFCDHQDLTNCNSTFCDCTNVINVPLGNVVEIILVDKGVTYNANHPFHLHGHPFRVVGMNKLGQTVDLETVKALDKANKLIRNLTNPAIKDTVTVPDGGYTILRVHANNPGYWLFHCHIEFHAEVGMAMIFKVGEHSDFSPIPKDFPRCGDYYSSPTDYLKTGSETDFQQGAQAVEYNVSTGAASDDDSPVSFSFWDSFRETTSHVTSDAVRYRTSFYSMFIIVILTLVH